MKIWTPIAIGITLVLFLSNTFMVRADGESIYVPNMPKIEIPELPEVTSHWLRMPSVSPDGKEVAFCWDGDIWLASVSGGTARRLTITEDNEYTPVHSPDGKWIAFRSMRNGNYDLFVMPSQGGVARRLTFSDSYDSPCCWLPDSSGIIFESDRQRAAVDLWVVRLSGGEPWPITDGGYRESEQAASISPDGKRIAYVNRGGMGQYRRRGYKGTSNNDIWVCDFDGVTTSNHQRVSDAPSNQTWPLWSGNSRLLVVSFDDGAEASSRYSQFAMLEEGGEGWHLRAAPDFLKGVNDVREPAIGGSTLVFNTGAYGGWHFHCADLESGTLSQPEIKLNTDVRRSAFTSSTLRSASEVAASPDGKKVAFVTGGEVYVMAADSNAVPRRVTNTVEREWLISWSPDSNQLLYSSARTLAPQIVLADLAEETEKTLTSAPDGASHAMFSPDGSRIIFIENERALRDMSTDGTPGSLNVAGEFLGANRDDEHWFKLSPKGEWAVYTQPNNLGDAQVVVTNLTSGETRQVSNRFGWCTDASFSADGKKILYSSSEADSYDIYAFDVSEEEPEFGEDALDKLFKRSAPAKSEAKKEKTDESKSSEATSEEKADPKEDTEAKKEDAKKDEAKTEKKAPALSIHFKDIEERTTRLTTFAEHELSPIGLKGDTLFFIGNVSRSSQIWKLTQKEGSAPSLTQVTKDRSTKSALHLSADQKYLWYLANGIPSRLPVTSANASSYRFSLQHRWNRDALQKASFDECIWVMDNYFYDPALHGIPWKTLTDHYAKALSAVSTGDEWGSLMNDLFGELNSSHQRFYPVDRRTDAYSESTGALGITFDPAGLSQGKYLIDRILKGGPCDLDSFNLKPGVEITAINGAALDGKTPVARHLLDTVGKRVVLTLRDTADAETREIKVKPVSTRSLSSLEYETWVEWQRAKVHELSGGRLGYVHIRSMDDSSVDHFIHHLGHDIEDKEGVVIDVRFNGGGRTAVDLLEILIKKPWLIRTRRGGQVVTENVNRSIALEKPSLLMTNYASFSNAEILSEGFRRLEIGPIVGTTTGGGVIGTTSHTLVDGSRMRLPLSGAYTIDGENLENNGRVPDVIVDTNPEELNQGHDQQLKVAVETLLATLPKR